MFLKISRILTGKHLCRSLYFNEVAKSASKETPAPMFSGEFCDIFKNNFSKNTSVRLFLIEYKYNDTNMIQINIKHNYIQFNEKMLLSIAVDMTFRRSRSQIEKHLCWNNFIKKRLQFRFFSKFLRTAFFIEHVSEHLYYFLIFSFCYVHQQLQNKMCFPSCIDIFRSRIFKRKM